MSEKEREQDQVGRGLPAPSAISEGDREKLACEAREWRTEIARRVDAIEAVSSQDYRVKAR